MVFCTYKIQKMFFYVHTSVGEGPNHESTVTTQLARPAAAKPVRISYTCRGRLPCRHGSSCRARLEVLDISIDKSVSRLQSADTCAFIDFGGLRRDNITGIPTPQPSQSRPTEPASGVGGCCHDVPRVAIGRDWRCWIFPLTRVYRASNPPIHVRLLISAD